MLGWFNFSYYRGAFSLFWNHKNPFVPIYPARPRIIRPTKIVTESRPNYIRREIGREWSGRNFRKR
jgi:hypothetical protein